MTVNHSVRFIHVFTRALVSTDCHHVTGESFSTAGEDGLQSFGLASNFIGIISMNPSALCMYLSRTLVGIIEDSI